MLICDVFHIKISTQNDTALHSTMGSSSHNFCARVVLTHVTQRTHGVQKSYNQFNDLNFLSLCVICVAPCDGMLHDRLCFHAQTHMYG